MTAVRYEITDECGGVKVRDCALSVRTGDSARFVAREQLRGAPPGWRIRLWYGVDLVGPLESLGEPDVVLVAE